MMSVRKLTMGLVSSLGVLVGVLVFASAPVQAVLTHPFRSSFGSFTNVQGVAVDQSSGDVYVFDAGAGSVFKFNAAGDPVNFSSSGTNVIGGVGGAGSGENEIAVDNSSGPDHGDIYVANNSVVRIYESTGAFLGELSGGEACGVAVDPAGEVYVGFYPETVRRYLPASNPVEDGDETASMVGLQGVCNVAADSDGDVYAATYSGGVSKYAASQFLVAPIGASGIEFDRAGSTLVVDPTGNTSTEDVYIDEESDVAEYEPSGQPLGISGVGSLSGSHGVAVSHSSGDLYAADGTGHVDIFGPAIAEAEVSTGAPSSVTETSATLNGAVNPGGVQVTACQFEYGTEEGVFPYTAACSLAPGDGESSVSVSANLTGLTAGVAYYFRLAATNANAVAFGREGVFRFSELSIAGPPGLPDGRRYELVSPPNKHGSEAGGLNNGIHPFMVAGVGGDEVAFNTTGPIGKTPTGYTEFSIARRSADGWKSHGALPRGRGTQELFYTNPQHGIGFSAEMTATVFGANDVFVPEQEVASPTPNLYVYGENEQVQWLGKPTSVEPLKFNGESRSSEHLAGASPDFNTIYFAFTGALVPADEEPNPELGDISHAEGGGYGFYEWHEGKLEAAGVLPDGHLDPYGAVPAATLAGAAETYDNQVSEDGLKAFFVSPDPAARSGRPSELYVRETAANGTQTTALVSRDLLPPEVDGQPADAPTGISEGEDRFYASPDGSHAFFQSSDRLTADAPSAEDVVREYEFDTATNTLTYLPGVADLSYTPCAFCEPPRIEIFRSSRDGSSFAFAREGKLELWNEGTVTTIGALQGASVKLTRASASGSVYVFQTSAPFSGFGFNNGEGSDEEIYRYEVAKHTLSCLSCPPSGTTPSGNAELSHDFPGDGNSFALLTGNRGISDDGGRVFFDTPDALVPQDTNGVRDAYEWEGGVLYLISTGVSTEPSYFGDNSPNGNDVFFSTTEGLAPGDADEGYDVYDARVPRPGDQLPPSAVPCEGAVCQGPPSVPQLLSPPASEAFNGAGNLAPSTEGRSATKPKPKAKARRKATKCAKGKRLSHGRCAKPKRKKKWKAKKTDHRRVR
jgi:hypothetical protein